MHGRCTGGLIAVLAAAAGVLSAVAIADEPGCPLGAPCPDPIGGIVGGTTGTQTEPEPTEPSQGTNPPPTQPPPTQPPPRTEPGSGQPPQGGDGGAGGPHAPGESAEDPPHAVVPRQALVERRGAVRLAIGCAGRGRCTGLLRVELRARGRATALARARFSVPVGDRVVLRLRLSREARRLLARRGRLAVVAVALTRPGEATERRSAARLTLRAGRRR